MYHPPQKKRKTNILKIWDNIIKIRNLIAVNTKKKNPHS